MDKHDIEMVITRDQLEMLGKHYKVDIESLEDYQLAELVDRAIDDLVTL